MLAHASAFMYAPEGGRSASVLASLRAAAHSMISSNTKNGTANITGSCISGGSTPESAFAKSTPTPPPQVEGRAGLPKVEYRIAPGGPDVQIDVVHDRVPPVDDQAWAIGFVIRRPLPVARQPIGAGLDGKVHPTGPHPRRHRRTGLQPAQFERDVLGSGDQIAPNVGPFGGVSCTDSHRLQHRGGPIESVQVYRRDSAVPLGQPDRRHPEADVARDTHPPGLGTAAAIDGPDLILRRQLYVGLFGGHLGEHPPDL